MAGDLSVYILVGASLCEGLFFCFISIGIGRFHVIFAAYGYLIW